jgi:hypothetical protein
MGTGVYLTFCEAKAIRESQMALGRKEGIALNLPGVHHARKALSNLMTTISAFPF